ncbi:hypothetical protein AB6A23_23915 [Paenibacillus tarimensis]
MNIVRYMILWAAFIILFTAAVLGLEFLEGYKIFTTEYYGLRNLGFAFVVIAFLIACVFYPVILLPVSMVIRRIISPFVGRLLIYCLLGGMGGIWVFHTFYSDDFVSRYQLNISSSILIFGAVGVLYALLDYYLERYQASAGKRVI